jgi:hypothetical protein
MLRLSSMMRARAIASGAGAALLALGAAAAAFEPPRIVNGLASTTFPTTGHLLYSGPFPIDDNNQGSWCSGTLIGCHTFLTAAHCVESDTNPAHYRVFLQHAGLFDVTSVTAHPSYTPSGFPAFDVAVLKLVSPVTSIDPSAINTTASPPPGSVGMIAGFGQTRGGAADYGIKRAGFVQTSSCAGIVPGLGDEQLVCWRFSNPLGTPGTDSNTCNGDSGGPLFVDLGAGEVVAGVTSGGSNGTCLPSDNSYDANVYAYRSFITGVLDADPTTSCGAFPAVGDPSVLVGGKGGFLSAAVPSKTFVVHVTGSPEEIRFVLNARFPAFDVDFFVKHGLGVSTIDYDCKADGISNFGDCVFPSPAVGEWSVLVRRFSGSGQFQLTTTILGGDPPVCGNDLAEFGEACDGTDDSACPGACEASCECPCEEQSIANAKVRSDAKVFRFKGEIDNSSRAFDGIDPRAEFAFALLQDAEVVSVELPPFDSGWAASKPEKGKYVWRGWVGGVHRIKLIDKTAVTGSIKLQVKGKSVPGAAAINVLSPYQIQTYFDLACNRIDL